MNCEQYVRGQLETRRGMMDAGLAVEHPDDFNERLKEEIADLQRQGVISDTRH